MFSKRSTGRLQTAKSYSSYWIQKHTKQHVLAELNSYAPMVSKGSYIVAMDGIIETIVGAPRTQPDWIWNNPRQAALEFVETNPDFVIEEPLGVGCSKSNRVAFAAHPRS